MIHNNVLNSFESNFMKPFYCRSLFFTFSVVDAEVIIVNSLITYQGKY